MRADLLHVFTARINPLLWRVPHAVYQAFAEAMLAAGVVLHVIECSHGERPFECEMPGVDLIRVRSKTMIWTKENLLNIGIRRTPEARYIAWIDSDVMFRSPTWAVDTVNALQLYDIIQPWTTAYDLGPNDEHLAAHKSFAKVWHEGGPLIPKHKNFWQGSGGPYAYPHSGYAWACTRECYEWVGGLLDIGGMGSGDHHMALGIAGLAAHSMPGGTHPNYRRHVMRWQERAARHINGNLGVVSGTIEHKFHGAKPKRDYIGRWDMFVAHQFDPDEDLKTNGYGVYELTGHKPELRRAFDRYLRMRNEDQNVP